MTLDDQIRDLEVFTVSDQLYDTFQDPPLPKMCFLKKAYLVVQCKLMSAFYNVVLKDIPGFRDPYANLSKEERNQEFGIFLRGRFVTYADNAADKGKTKLTIMEDYNFHPTLKETLVETLLHESDNPCYNQLAREFYQWSEKHPGNDPNGIDYITSEGNVELDFTRRKERHDQEEEEARKNNKPRNKFIIIRE